MHTLQKLLITRLVKNNGIPYSVLTRDYDSEDNIAFHLKQLVSKDLVEKRDEKYFLTAQGIQTLATFQKTDLQDNAFKMFYVGFLCECEGSFLIKPHEKAKERFYNLPSGSPLFGEGLKESIPRIFHEETNTYVSFDSFEFDSLHLKTVKTTAGEVLFDDAFGVYKVTVTTEQKDMMDLEKGCVWMNRNEIIVLTNKHPEIDMCVLEKDWKTYSVYDVICDYVIL